MRDYQRKRRGAGMGESVRLGNNATSVVGMVIYPSASLSRSDLFEFDFGTNRNNPALFTAEESGA